jgi:hypothetical protein
MDKNKVEEVRKFVEENKRWPRTKETRIYGICLAARNYYNQNKLRNYYRLKEEEAKEIIEIMEPYKNGGRIYVQRFKDFIVKNKRLPNSNKPEERIIYFTYYSALVFPVHKYPGPYIKLLEEEARQILELAEKYNKRKDKVGRFKRFISKHKHLPGVKDKIPNKIYKSAKNYQNNYNVNYYKLDKEDVEEILEIAKPYEKDYVRDFEKFIRNHKRLPRRGNDEQRAFRTWRAAIDFPEYDHKKHAKLTEEEVIKIRELIKEVE